MGGASGQSRACRQGGKADVVLSSENSRRRGRRGRPEPYDLSFAGTISSDERMVKCAFQETYGNEETNSARYEMAADIPVEARPETTRQGIVCSVSAGPACLLRHDAISFNNESAY